MRKSGLKAIRVNDDAHGKRCYKVPVIVHLNDSITFNTQELRLDIVAHSAVEAANWVCDNLDRAECEVYAYGPRGGETYRYRGWFSHIGSQLFKLDPAGQQLSFNLTEVSS